LNVNKQFVCIKCPKGCLVDVEYDDNSKEIYKIEGNSCFRGKNYVTEEIVCPKRLLTTTVKVKNGLYAVVPVATSLEIEKSKLFLVMAALSKVEVKAPIKSGDIIVANILDTKADIIAQCDMDELTD